MKSSHFFLPHILSKGFRKYTLKTFSKAYILLILLSGTQLVCGQSWSTFSVDNFNGLPYESCYSSGGSATFWGDCNTSNPRNSLINGTWEVANTTLGTTQSPSNASGGRFLMYWTNSDNSSGSNVFYRKTITNAIVGQQYRVSFKIGTLTSGSRPNISLRRTMSSSTTTLYTETDANFPTDNWATVSYAGTGNTGSVAMLFTATSTTFTLEWLNAQTTGSGNDFGIDDILIETTVYSVSGTVYDDFNGSTGGVNGTVLSAVPVTLYASDEITQLATTTTSASGIYSFPNLLAGSYIVAITPLSGYNHVSSTDATPLNGRTSTTVTNANIVGINFGINQPPTTNAISQTISAPSSSQITQGTITQAVSGNDPGVGLLSNGSTVVVTTLPTNGTLYYNGLAVTAGSPITSFSPSLLSVTGLTTGSSSVQFSYAFIDAAGLQGSSANYIVSWVIIMPVKWNTITAKQISQGFILLEWSTHSEQNNKGFAIEYSADGITWVAIGFEESLAKDGSSNNGFAYKYSHTQPQSGNNYYRLKQMDLDGNYQYSAPILLKYNLAENNLFIYPNPSFGNIYLRYNNNFQVKTIQLFDVSGKLVKNFNNAVLKINIADLPQGYYYIKVTSKTLEQRIYKIVKNQF